jgi:hypothetical protein
MKRDALNMPRWKATGTSLFLLLTLILSACSLNLGGSSTVNSQATPRNGNTQVKPTSAGLRIQLGAQPCPDVVKEPAHWSAVIGLGAGQTVEQALCGNLMGVSALQAVVLVRHPGDDHILDVSVYNDITGSSPAVVFTQRGLVQGDARISGYNTLLTAQADPHSSVNKALPVSQLARDLFREFKWSDSAGTFVQVAFQGLFPDLTRYQAEIEQDEVNQGQGFQQWRLDVVQSAQAFANTFLNWAPDAPVTVLSGGGAHDYKAMVEVHSTVPGGGSIRIAFSRLEGNNNGGLWEATAIEVDGLSITSPQNAQRLTSPVMVAGINTAYPGKITVIKILDHNHADIGHVTLARGPSSFSSTLPYTASFQGGTQEGLIGLYAYTNSGATAALTMVKVLLSA